MASPLDTSKFYFSAALQAKLNVAQTKSAWGGLVKGDLGSTRTAKIIRYASAQAAADKTGGTVLRSATNTGALTLTGGDLSGLGVLSGVTINQAVDFSSGFHVLSFETPGGVEMRGAIGLSLAAQINAGVAAGSEVVYVFTTEGNLDAAKGWLLGDINIFAPKFMPTGIGPKVPELTANAPHTVELWDWANPASPVLADSVVIDKRWVNWEFEHRLMAESNGDTRVDTSSRTLKLGSFQFPVMRTVQYHDGVEPLYQTMLGIMAYNTTWANTPSYPMMVNYGVKTDETHPPPFKVVVKNAAGQVLNDWKGRSAIEMHDGLPVNSPDLHQRFDLDQTKPLRPHACIGQTLIHESRRPRDNPNRNRFPVRVSEDTLMPSLAKARGTCNPSEPMDGPTYQQDSLGHMHFMPQWPLSKNDRAWAAQARADDPHMWDPATISPLNYPFQWWGWDDEPASRSGRSVYDQRGGPRFERSCLPSIYMWYATKPDGVRMAGNVPLRDMAHAWRRAQHNMGARYLENSPDWIPAWTNADAEVGNLGLLNTAYYGNGPIVNPTKVLNVPIAGAQANYDDGQRGPTGRLVSNGRAWDPLHFYNHSAVDALMFNDPVNAIMSRHDYRMIWACSIGGRGPNGGADFLVRTHAWRILAYTMAWLMGSKHPMGIQQASIEARMKLEWEGDTWAIYKRAILDNEQSFEMKTLRGFGQRGNVYDYGNKDPNNGPITIAQGVKSASGTLGMYMGHALLLMKYSGLWDVMVAKSERCATVGKFLIDCLDKQCIDYFAAGADYAYPDWTYAENGGYLYFLNRIPREITLDDLPANYEEWVKIAPPPAPGPDGSTQTWTRWPDGSLKGQEAGQNLISQWVMAREWAFPEYPNPKTAAAVARLREALAWEKTKVATIPSLLERANKHGVYRVPSHGEIVKPAV